VFVCLFMYLCERDVLGGLITNINFALHSLIYTNIYSYICMYPVQSTTHIHLPLTFSHSTLSITSYKYYSLQVDMHSLTVTHTHTHTHKHEHTTHTHT